jgi:hypothetical protein
MRDEDWEEFARIFEEYNDARKAWEHAQAILRGSFSELARYYQEGTLNENRLYEETKAHERFNEKRQKLNEFLKARLKKHDA